MPLLVVVIVVAFSLAVLEVVVVGRLGVVIGLVTAVVSVECVGIVISSITSWIHSTYALIRTNVPALSAFLHCC